MMRSMLSNPELIRQMMQAGAGRGGFGGGGAAPNPFANLAQGTGSEATPEAAGGANRAAAGQTPGSPPPAAGQAPNPLAGLFGANAGTGMGGAGAGNPFGFDPAMMQQMQQMFGGGAGGAGGFGGFGGAPAAPQDTRPAEERFQEQLRQLNEMGLVNPQQNIRALTMTGGNVQAAIELIFSGSVPPS